MKIALAQIDPTVGDFAGNTELILKFADRARERGADLVVFPELAICGYPPRDLVEKPDFLARSEAAVEDLARRLPKIAALVGSVRRAPPEQGKPAMDVAVLLNRGRRLLEYAKILLPYYDVFDESRYFAPGNSPAVFSISNLPIGVTICEDAWNDKHFWKNRLYTRDPVEETTAAGAKFLLNIAASPYTTEKIGLRHDMLRALALRHGAPVIYVNQVGGNDQLIFDGSSMAFDAAGNLRARAKSFEEDMVLWDSEGGSEEIRAAPEGETEEIYQALLLGVRDYCRKCGFKRALVGLSGGIDSSLVATLAADALGAANVQGVSMPGPFSSPGSVTDAEALARALGIDFRIIPITPLYQSFLHTLAPAFEKRARDVTEENIQARIRGNILMALSNKFGAIVLSTGNKSELAVGYCTLYGDMAGGLAVIADVPKTTVYALARYANRNTPRIPAASFEKPPSAELRPDQTDQDTLPPYDVLDRILKSFIEDGLCAREIAARFGIDPKIVAETVRRVNAAEYKRQQAPPALKVNAKAFGMGRRYPIAQKYSDC